MSRVQRTRQNLYKFRRHALVLALAVVAVELAAGIALQVLDRRAPEVAGVVANAEPLSTLQNSVALQTTTAPQTSAPVQGEAAIALPTAAQLVPLPDVPQAGTVEPPQAVNPQIKDTTATLAAPIYCLMPADFLRDDLTGKDALALKRLLKRWGFSASADKGAWNAEDAYHLSLYQRWANGKPSGAVDAATRKSLLASWNKYADQAIPREKLPLEGVYIGLNPGHQNRNYDQAITLDNEERFWDITVGTRGRATGLYEYELNLTVALKVRDALQAQGARVLLSRTGNDVRVSNSSRTKQLNREQVDAVLLIHADGNADTGLHGLHMIVSTAGGRQAGAVLQRSHALADAMQSACIAQTQAADRGVGERDDLRILLSSCAMPAALIEMGYMTNPDEDRLLATKEYQDRIVAGIVQGFLTFFHS